MEEVNTADNAVRINDKTDVEKRTRIFYLLIKRGVDIIVSALSLLFLSPALLVIALLIRLEDGSPAIYRQNRIGKNGKPFVMYKFRSMCIDADKKLASLQDLNERDGPVFKISNDPRVTKIGHFIRKTCIDELPQLFNILKGDMSIVGPRPPLPNEVLQYNEHHMQRLSITPGLTCFWQVQKGESTTFEEWVELDIKYIKEQGLLTDLKLILQTIKVVLRGFGDK